jgi:hypothetical protein
VQLFHPREETSFACFQLSDEVLTVPNQATTHALEQDFVSRLARFFPEATPVRIPVRLSRAAGNGIGNFTSNGNGNDHTVKNGGAGEKNAGFIQDTVIEFGTPREVLFMVKRPLEFADQVLIESKDGSLRAEASVVAVQYHPEKTVVAVRFLKHVPNWIVKS